MFNDSANVITYLYLCSSYLKNSYQGTPKVDYRFLIVAKELKSQMKGKFIHETYLMLTLKLFLSGQQKLNKMKGFLQRLAPV